ncbi:MAG: Na/Pi symporter [Salinibacterium sp.]|nr:Na/Pi symporter [Salinibacterium sp.]
MHDFFNIMAVLIFMPLEMATGILRRLATTLAKSVYGEADGGKLDNPIKAITKPIANGLRDFFQDGLDLSPGWTGGLMLALALLTLFLALVWITRTMRSLMLEKMEASLNKVLERSGILAIFVGLVLTVSVQSSSITTSLMIPLFAAGILKLENGFPVTLGANIGTTVTAMIAAMASDINGLTIAFVHLLFNVGATLAIYPFPPLRRVPIRLAMALADLATRNKFYAVFYVVVFFVIIPLIGNLVFR